MASNPPISRESFKIKMELILRSALNLVQMFRSMNYPDRLIDDESSRAISMMFLAVYETRHDDQVIQVNPEEHGAHVTEFYNLINGYFSAILIEIAENRTCGMPITLSLGTEQMIIKAGVEKLTAASEEFFRKGVKRG